MNKNFRITVLSAVSVLLLGLALALTAQAQSGPPQAELVDPTLSVNSGVTSKVISQAEQEAALAFWTREAIAAAQPLEMLSQLGPVELDTTTAAELETASEVTGPPGFVAGGRPAPDANLVAQAAYPLDWAIATADSEATAALDAEVLAPTGSGQVFTRYVVNKADTLWQIYPHTTIGRASFTDHNGQLFNCSASAISGNVMLTAAHCLYDTSANRWVSNFVFTPAYRNGATPFGTFPATECWILNAWINLSGSPNIQWVRWDVGVCKMGKNSAGQTLNNAVGSLGRRWNASYVRHFHTFGYPGRDTNDQVIPDSGKYLQVCVAESFQPEPEWLHFNTRGMGCDLGKGMSGGPWVRNYGPTVGGEVDGVSSVIERGKKNTFGPRFSDHNIVVLCNSVGC